MVSVEQEENSDPAADALASLRRATKELKEAADIFENNFQDEAATGLELGTVRSLLYITMFQSGVFHLLTRRFSVELAS